MTTQTPPLQVCVVHEPTREVKYRCATVGEAEAFIAGLAAGSPETKQAVEAGDYGIDAPEDLT